MQAELDLIVPAGIKSAIDLEINGSAPRVIGDAGR